MNLYFRNSKGVDHEITNKEWEIIIGNITHGNLFSINSILQFLDNRFPSKEKFKKSGRSIRPIEKEKKDEKKND